MGEVGGQQEIATRSQLNCSRLGSVVAHSGALELSLSMNQTPELCASVAGTPHDAELYTHSDMCLAGARGYTTPQVTIIDEVHITVG
jgi:hypothetical protein